MRTLKSLALGFCLSLLTGCSLSPAKPVPPAKPVHLTARQACLNKRQEGMEAAMGAAEAGENLQDVLGNLGGFAPCPGEPGPGSHARYLAAQKVYYHCLKESAVMETSVKELPYGAVPVTRASHDWAELHACMAAHGQN